MFVEPLTFFEIITGSRLIEIPSRKKLRQKNLFNVTKCNMVWQNDGDYLAVKVTRHTKSKKTLYNNIERKIHLLKKPAAGAARIEILYRSPPLKMSKIFGRGGSVGKPSDMLSID